MFEGDKISVNNIIDLIRVIKQSNPILNKNPHLFSLGRLGIDIYEQSRHGKEDV